MGFLHCYANTHLLTSHAEHWMEHRWKTLTWMAIGTVNRIHLLTTDNRVQPFRCKFRCRRVTESATRISNDRRPYIFGVYFNSIRNPWLPTVISFCHRTEKPTVLVRSGKSTVEICRSFPILCYQMPTADRDRQRGEMDREWLWFDDVTCRIRRWVPRSTSVRSP